MSPNIFLLPFQKKEHFRNQLIFQNEHLPNKHLKIPEECLPGNVPFEKRNTSEEQHEEKRVSKRVHNKTDTRKRSRQKNCTNMCCDGATWTERPIFTGRTRIQR